MVERVLQNRNVLKVVAFFLALLLWFFVNSDGRDQQTNQLSRIFSNIPVGWQNLDDDLTVIRRPANVEVVIRGESGVLDEMTPQDLMVYVDFQGLEAGVHTVQVTGTTPRGTRITSISPNEVEVEIDAVINLQMDVEVVISGNPEEGFVTGTPKVDPQQVFVQGPRNQIHQVARIFTVVDIQGSDEDVQVMASPLIHDYSGRLVTGVSIIPENVEVLVPVEHPEKDVSVHVPLVGEPESGFRMGEMTISPSRIRVSALMGILADILRVETEPVDITGARDDITLEVSLILPQGVQVEKKTIAVTIPIIPEEPEEPEEPEQPEEVERSP